MEKRPNSNKKFNKILLLVPPAYIFKGTRDINPIPPLGLAYIAAVLTKDGREVNILDCLAEGWESSTSIDDNVERIGLSFEEIEKRIRDFSPDIVGVSSHFTRQRDNAHRIYKLVKTIDKNIITVAGGAHPTADPEEEIKGEFLDYIILGEGEDSFLELLKYLEGTLPEDKLDGISFKKDNKPYIIPKNRFIEDLDSIPMPSYELINWDKYFGQKYCHGMRKKDRYMPVITSRGCPFGCVFCSASKVWGRKFRTRSPENVIEELKFLKKKYGIEEIIFEDDNLTLDVERAEKLFDLMIKENLNLIWDTPNGVAAFALNERIIKKMKKSGCYCLNLAIESGNQSDLDKIIKKPLDLKKVPPLLKYAKKIGMETGIFIVIGIPGQTEKSMKDSFRYAAKLGIYDPFISIATPYPGTELYSICKDNNYLPGDFNLDKLSIYRANITTPDFTPEKLLELRDKFCRYLIWQERFKSPKKLIKDILAKAASCISFK
ncbi:MAG: radical SAM protein [Armatimonadota bacterium]